MPPDLTIATPPGALPAAVSLPASPASAVPTAQLPPHSAPVSATAKVPVADLDEKVKKICEEAGQSVVLVTYTPARLDLIKAQMKAVRPPQNSADIVKKTESIAEHQKVECYYSTGFVVGEDPRQVLILTCAHTVAHCYDAQHPITAMTVNGLYKISITCDHLKLKYKEKKGRWIRQYVTATVLEVNCQKDLLLLRVNKAMLKKKCRLNHPPLQIGQTVPEPLGKVVMVSWPLLRHRTVSKGEMSHQMREFADISNEEVSGYNLRGIEVNITSEEGSSGAPLLDMESRYIGVLHGGRIDCFTYYVSLTDVRESLIGWGVIKK